MNPRHVLAIARLTLRDAYRSRMLPSVLFMLGLIYATLKMGDRRLFPFVAWYWSAVFAGGVLADAPPNSQRLITLAPAVVFFVVLAIDRATAIAERIGRRPAGSLAYASVVVAAMLAIASSYSYFVDFAPKYAYGSYNGLVATDLGKYLRDLGPDVRFAFAGTPRMYADFPTIPYLAPNATGTNITQPLTAPIPRATADAPDRFVLLPERQADLKWIQATYPGGVVREFPSPIRPEPLFIVYELAP